MRVCDQPGAYLGDFLARAGADWHHREWGFRKVIAAGAATAAMSAANTPARKAPAMSRTESTFPLSDSDPETQLHTASSTAHLLDELALHGHLPGPDEPDPRPLPEPEVVRGQLGAMFEASSPWPPAVQRSV